MRHGWQVERRNGGEIWEEKGKEEQEEERILGTQNPATQQVIE